VRVEAQVRGRETELDAIAQRFAAAAGGREQLVLVEGEAGIGKTELIAEALRRAEARGLAAFCGRADPLERHRPFGALADDLSCRRDSPDPERAALARLLSTGEAGGGPGLQYRALEACADLVERLARSSPVALALEDLHWADPGTLSAVAWLARRLPQSPVALLGTFRPSPARPELDQLLAASTGGEDVTHVRLGPLDEETVAELVGRVVGAPPGPRLRAEVAKAGGNPLYVLELVRALSDEGALAVSAGKAELTRAELPASLRRTLLRRLSVLPEDTLAMLRLASILGSTFSFTDLTRLSGRSATDLVVPLEDARRAGIVGEAGDDLAFRHDLIREAVYEELPRAVRRGLHLEAGRLLAAAGAPVGRVATQFSLGATPGDEEAVGWLVRAAREAAPRAPGVAVELYQRALDITQPADARRDALLAELVGALLWSGRVTEAESLARQVLERPHDPAVEGRLRLAWARALFLLRRAPEALEVLERPSPAGVLPDDEVAQMAADAAWARVMCGDLDCATAGAEEARCEAQRLGDDVALVVATNVLSLVALFRGHLAEALALAAQVTADVERSADQLVKHFPAHYWQAMCLVDADRLDEAAEVILAGSRAAEAWGNAWVKPWLQATSALRRFLTGEWDDAIAEVEASLALAGDLGAQQGSTYGHSVVALISLHRGDLEGAEATLARAERQLGDWKDAGYRGHWLGWARALLVEAHGRQGPALATMEEAWKACSAVGLVSEYVVVGPDLVRLALQSGDARRAQAVTEAVGEAAARMAVPSAAAAALRCRGLLESDPDTLLASVAAYRRAPRPFERAVASEEAGAALRRAGRVDEAVPVLEQALGVYTELAATRPMARVEAALRELGIRRGGARRPARATVGWESLTRTELAVARLVVEGLTNRQIGERLFVSRRTVETHLAHVFQKLGISTRAQLAAEAGRRAAKSPG
jgi:DNA-binding CsgD family transcriptional regulator